MLVISCKGVELSCARRLFLKLTSMDDEVVLKVDCLMSLVDSLQRMVAQKASRNLDDMRLYRIGLMAELRYSMIRELNRMV